MKKVKLKIVAGMLSFAICSGGLSAQTFLHNIDQAQQQAQEEAKPMLLIFSGSDWCKPCMQLKKNIISSEAFTTFADSNLVLLEVDFPYRKKNQLSKEQKKHNSKLADQYNPKGVFPLMVVLDESLQIKESVAYDPRLTAHDYIRKLNSL